MKVYCSFSGVVSRLASENRVLVIKTLTVAFSSQKSEILGKEKL